MIEASKLKAGMTLKQLTEELIRVLEASHHKPGKGNTIMRMKLRDVRTWFLHLTQATVQRKNLNKPSSRLSQLNTCTKWMTQPTS